MNALFLGRRQHGKTTLSIHQALMLQKRTGCGILVYDVNSQVNSFPDDIAYSLTEVESKLTGRPRPKVLIYRAMGGAFAPDEAELLDDDFSAFARIIWEKSNYVLVVDESHWLQSASYCNPSLAAFVRMSDPHGIHLFQSAHAPADMWGRARGLASDWYIFHLMRNADLEAVKLQCGEEVADAAKNLGQHDYVHFDMDKGTHEIVTDPASWYVPVAKVPELDESYLIA